jgi:alkylation response protein AidB-like acyl-CoA dehydrogenase
MSRTAHSLLLGPAHHALWATGPDRLITGTLQPAGTATADGDGWILTSRWPFVTGDERAHWLLLCASVPCDEGSATDQLPHDAITGTLIAAPLLGCNAGIAAPGDRHRARPATPGQCDFPRGTVRALAMATG